jgi:hypothetical protein
MTVGTKMTCNSILQFVSTGCTLLTFFTERQISGTMEALMGFPGSIHPMGDESKYQLTVHFNTLQVKEIFYKESIHDPCHFLCFFSNIMGMSPMEKQGHRHHVTDK